jgi:ribosome-binding ATPase YchF (GTP1/OBG family)
MKLEIKGIANTNQCAKQHVLVRYDPVKNITIIDTEVDVVTLGLAVRVLTEQFNKALGNLDTELAERINTITKEVVENG